MSESDEIRLSCWVLGHMIESFQLLSNAVPVFMISSSVAEDPRKSCQRVDTDSDRKFENEGARLDTNWTDF